MPEIKSEELLKVVLPGFEVKDETTIDEITTEFEKTHVSMDVHTKQIASEKGKWKGSEEAKFKAVLNKLGITSESYTGKDLAEMAAMASKKADEVVAEIVALKESAKNTDSGKGKKELEKLQKELADLRSLDTAKEGKIKELNDELAAAKLDGDTKLVAHILNNKINELFNSANWTDDSDKIVKKGVWSEYFDDTYIFKSDGDKVFVYKNDAENTMIMDGVNQMTAEKIFENTLKEVKRFKENKGTGKGLPTNGIGEQTEGKTKTASQIAHEKSIMDKMAARVKQ